MAGLTIDHLLQNDNMLGILLIDFSEDLNEYLIQDIDQKFGIDEAMEIIEKIDIKDHAGIHGLGQQIKNRLSQSYQITTPGMIGYIYQPFDIETEYTFDRYRVIQRVDEYWGLQVSCYGLYVIKTKGG
jgi:hypothetical protein